MGVPCASNIFYLTVVSDELPKLVSKTQVCFLPILINFAFAIIILKIS